jgi:peptidoglycan-N-acetylmuramic acid deacetylase
MVKEGHIVGNHSWNHPDFTVISNARLRGELEKVRIKTEELTGQKKMIFLRPPRGVFSERTLSISKELGYRNVFWSVAFVDWNVKEQKGPQYAYEQIIKQIHPGAVLLLHAISSDNAAALGQIIDELRKKGYTFKSLTSIK